MEGQLKVSAVQVSVQDGNIDVNMANVERMAMKIAENEKGVDLILFHEACLESGTPHEKFDEAVTERVVEFWKKIAAKTGSNILAGRLGRQGHRLLTRRTHSGGLCENSPVQLGA